MLTPRALKELLKSHGLRLSKRLGQNHLISADSAKKIIDCCDLTRSDKVLEIGAGLGALTEPLAERAGDVIAVEIDRGICALLRERLRELQNVEILCEDILKLNLESFSASIVVGAIPYQITSAILVSLFEARKAAPKAVLVLQKEVAERLMARPGTKAYGRLSVLGQFAWEISKVSVIPRRAFFPEPQVDSVCIRMVSLRNPPVELKDEAMFFELVKSAFATRRKTLVNCLLSRNLPELNRAKVLELLRSQGLAGSVRGEELSLGKFGQLANALAD